MPNSSSRPPQPLADTVAAQYSNARRVVEILDDYLAGLKAGTAPSRDRLLAQYPDLASELAECLEGIDFLQRGSGPREIPEKLGDFQLIREVGRGGMGAVYEAQQLSLGRRVAVKVLRFGAGADVDAVDRFRREAETIARLHHTHIVPIFAVGNDEGIRYYAMQFIEGSSLDQLLKASPQGIAPETVASWGRMAADALAHAHERGIVHRDVKPSNLILDSQQHLWLTDFGLAKHAEDVTLSVTGALLGTPRYMSPEQAAFSTQRDLDHRTDIYSLGATLYELVTGEPVFRGESTHQVISQILSADPVPARQHRPEVPRDLETILTKCLAKAPEARYATAEALSDDLRAFLEGRPISARRPNWVDQANRWVRKQRRSLTIVGAAIGITLLVVAAITTAFHRYQQWQLGSLELDTQTPPLISRITSQNQTADLGAFTVPHQQPIEAMSGDYQVQVEPTGQLSQTYDLYLPRGQITKLDLSQNDNFVDEQTIPGALAMAYSSSEGKTRLLSFTDEGIQSWGDRSWVVPIAAWATTQETGRRWIWPCNRLLGLVGGDLLGFDAFDCRPWLAVDSLSTGAWPPWSGDPWQPIRAGTAVDLNGDQVDDVIVAGRHQAWMLAISGENGDVLWRAELAQEFNVSVWDDDPERRAREGVLSAVVHPPEWIDDVDEDGTRDLLACVLDVGSDSRSDAVEGRIAAISGATGKLIWSYPLPAESLMSNNDTPEILRWFPSVYEGSGTSSSSVGQFAGGRYSRINDDAIERNGKYFQTPHPPRLVKIAGKVFVTCVIGSSLQIVDLRTGQPVGKPYSLGMTPGLTPRVADLDGDAYDDLLLVFRLPDRPAVPKVSHTAPQLRLVAWSGNTRNVIWQHDVVAAWPSRTKWHDELPDWPLVEDMDGDGVCEVLVPHDTSRAQSQRDQIVSPWGGLLVLDGKSGTPRWHRPMMTIDQGIDHFVVGRDLDHDGHREVFVATPWGQPMQLYLDCLSGKTGRTIWTSRQDLGLAWNDTQLRSLRYRSDRADGPGELVVQADRNRSPHPNDSRHFIFRDRDGQLTSSVHLAYQLVTTELDGDAMSESVVVKLAGLYNLIHDGSEVAIYRGAAEIARRLVANSTTVDDLDGDGVKDLIESTDPGTIVSRSSVTGNVLWTSDLPRYPQQVLHAPHPSDLNGDGTPDLFAFPQEKYTGRPQTPLRAINGRDGKTLWQSPHQARAILGTGVLNTIDLNADGRLEVVVVASHNGSHAKPTSSMHATQIQLEILDGGTGRPLWRRPLSGPYGDTNTPAPSPYEPFHLKLEIQYLDLNEDGWLDLIVPSEKNAIDLIEWQENTSLSATLCAFSGKDGKRLWQLELPRIRDEAEGLQQVARPVVLPATDKDKAQLAVLAFEDQADTPGGGPRSAHVMLVDPSTGQRQATWSSEVHPRCGTLKTSDRVLRRPRPLLVRTPAGPRVGVMLESAVPRWVLIDRHGTATSDANPWLEVDENEPQCWIDDLDGDQIDEMLLIRAGRLVACRTTDSRDLFWQTDESVADVIGFFAEANTSRKLIAFRSAPDHEFWLADLSNGAPVCQCANPVVHTDSFASFGTASVLGPFDNELALRQQASPVVQFLHGNTLVVRQASAVKLGLEHHNLAMIPEPPLRPRQQIADERWRRPLPWIPRFAAGQAVRQMLLPSVTALFWCFSLVIIPVWFGRQMFRDRRWSLKRWLALPAVVALFLAGLFGKSDIIELTSAFPDSRIIVAMMTLPVVALVSKLITLAFRREWKPLWIWLMLTVVVACLLAAISLGVTQPNKNGPLLPGETYSWTGWYWIWLYGTYIVGWAVLVFSPVAAWLPRLREFYFKTKSTV